MTASPPTVSECQAALEKCGVPPAKDLAEYMRLVLEFNQQVNLTGAKSCQELALKHVADVWGAFQAIGGVRGRVIDVGSGAGIPGIILGILSPETEVFLVERRQKKASALSHIVSKLGLEGRVKVISKSFEEVPLLPKGAEIWMRGFLPGPKLAEYISRYWPRADLPTLVLMKGPGWGTEKLEIMNQQRIKGSWKERFASAEEISYALPHDAGQRVLVLV